MYGALLGLAALWGLEPNWLARPEPECSIANRRHQLALETQRNRYEFSKHTPDYLSRYCNKASYALPPPVSAACLPVGKFVAQPLFEPFRIASPSVTRGEVVPAVLRQAVGVVVESPVDPLFVASRCHGSSVPRRLPVPRLEYHIA